MALKFGSKSGTGYTRDPFPSHNGVQPGPLNSDAPTKFDWSVSKDIMGEEEVTKETTLPPVGTKGTETGSKSGGTYESAKKKDPDLDKHIAERNRRQESGENTATVQNVINKAYGNPKRHKEEITKMARIGDPSTPSEKPIEAKGIPPSTITQADAKKKGTWLSRGWDKFKKFRESEGGKALSEGLMDLGASRTFQGEGAKSFTELQGARETQKTKDALSARKMDYTEKKYKTDLASQNILDQNRQLLIDAKIKANEQELASHGSFAQGENINPNENVYDESLEENVKKRRT